MCMWLAAACISVNLFGSTYFHLLHILRGVSTTSLSSFTLTLNLFLSHSPQQFSLPCWLFILILLFASKMLFASVNVLCAFILAFCSFAGQTFTESTALFPDATNPALPEQTPPMEPMAVLELFGLESLGTRSQIPRSRRSTSHTSRLCQNNLPHI